MIPCIKAEGKCEIRTDPDVPFECIYPADKYCPWRKRLPNKHSAPLVPISAGVEKGENDRQ
jgi:hypothetical protein